MAEQLGWRGLVRRIALGDLPLIAALGFTFGLAATGLQEARARPVGGLSSGCYHKGRYIAHGHVIEMTGVPSSARTAGGSSPIFQPPGDPGPIQFWPLAQGSAGSHCRWWPPARQAH